MNVCCRCRALMPDWDRHQLCGLCRKKQRIHKASQAKASQAKASQAKASQAKSRRQRPAAPAYRPTWRELPSELDPAVTIRVISIPEKLE